MRFHVVAQVGIDIEIPPEAELDYFESMQEALVAGVSMLAESVHTPFVVHIDSAKVDRARSEPPASRARPPQERYASRVERQRKREPGGIAPRSVIEMFEIVAERSQ